MKEKKESSITSVKTQLKRPIEYIHYF